MWCGVAGSVPVAPEHHTTPGRVARRIAPPIGSAPIPCSPTSHGTPVSAPARPPTYSRVLSIPRQRPLPRLRIPRHKYFPVPGVDGALVTFRLAPPSKRPEVPSERSFHAVVAKAFSERRKMMRNSMQPLYSSQQVGRRRGKGGARSGWQQGAWPLRGDAGHTICSMFLRARLHASLSGWPGACG